MLSALFPAAGFVRVLGVINKISTIVHGIEGVVGGVKAMIDGNYSQSLLTLGGSLLNLAGGGSACKLLNSGSPILKLGGYVMKRLNYYNAISGGIDGVQSIINGDVSGGLLKLGQAGFDLYSASQSCFVAGTPLLTPDGAKPIEQFVPGDLVLSRNEDDPDAPVVARRVLVLFERVY